MSEKKVAIIAGAGPAGLTAALELLRRSDIKPLVFEADAQVGGLSKTVNYRGNRMDLGGHRFFSKSDWVMRWWQEILPLDPVQASDKSLQLTYQQNTTSFKPEPRIASAPDNVMLVRERLSRIFYKRRFFDYPLKLSVGTLRNLGFSEALLIGLSYGKARLAPRLRETSLEDFLINRFGNRLYRTFFKDYTEKVWGINCREISAEWGAQRIKGLSVTKALAHAIAAPFRSAIDTAQKHTETSLVERFLYPKLGPGQMWEEVARRVVEQGGNVHLRHRVVDIERRGFDIVAVLVSDESTGAHTKIPCHSFISTLPISDLSAMLRPEDPEIRRITDNLPYRDFVTVGLLLRKMAFNGKVPPDNWIYIQERDVRLGRLQVFNNWSASLVADHDTIWLGLEYFCQEGDGLWTMDDHQFIEFAALELETIGIANREDVLDGTVVRVAKAYPAYFGEYRNFGVVRTYLDRFSNLYPVGRNGMHRYNNQDHSMLAANAAVDCILKGGAGKSQIWNINTESEYHEQVKS